MSKPKRNRNQFVTWLRYELERSGAKFQEQLNYKDLKDAVEKLWLAKLREPRP